DPKLGAPANPMEAIVAYADTNGDLTSPTGSGFARLVIPGDNAGGRFVSNLVDLEVVNAVPEPTSALPTRLCSTRRNGSSSELGASMKAVELLSLLVPAVAGGPVAADDALPKGDPGEVRWLGEQRKVVRDGDLTGRVDLTALAKRPHLYAAG